MTTATTPTAVQAEIVVEVGVERASTVASAV